jgi:hypothetical protein
MGGSSNQGSSVGAIAAIPVAGLLILIAFVIGIAAAAGGANCHDEGEALTSTLKGGVPKKLVPIYQAAAVKYRLGPKGPAMLASIHFNETSFGTNTENTTGSGAEGQMMFMPETWAAYGVDANGDGKQDPHDPEDAIFAAARYLQASGAPDNWHDAIFAYNHAEWYVQRIEEDYRTFRGSGMETVAGGELGEACGPSIGGEAMVDHAQRLFQPQAFKLLPGALWQLVERRRRSMRASTRTRSGFLRPMTCAPRRPEREATKPTATAPLSTSSRPRSEDGTAPPSAPPKTWAGGPAAHHQGRLRYAHWCQRSSSSATTATTPSTATQRTRAFRTFTFLGKARASAAAHR